MQVYARKKTESAQKAMIDIIFHHDHKLIDLNHPSSYDLAFQSHRWQLTCGEHLHLLRGWMSDSRPTCLEPT